MTVQTPDQTSLFFYIGGSVRGEWRRVLCTPAEFAVKEQELKRAGYLSRRAVSAPQTRPSRERQFMLLG